MIMIVYSVQAVVVFHARTKYLFASGLVFLLHASYSYCCDHCRLAHFPSERNRFQALLEYCRASPLRVRIENNTGVDVQYPWRNSNAEMYACKIRKVKYL